VGNEVVCTLHLSEGVATNGPEGADREPTLVMGEP